MSVATPVVSKAPWLKSKVRLERAVPAPIALPWPTLAPSRSSKVTEVDLKPTVLTLAMLSPITDMALPLVFRPLMPEKREERMDMKCSWLGVCWEWSLKGRRRDTALSR